MKVDLECTKCNAALKRAGIDAHDCIKHFLKVTSDQKTHIEDLERQIKTIRDLLPQKLEQQNAQAAPAQVIQE